MKKWLNFLCLLFWAIAELVPVRSNFLFLVSSRRHLKNFLLSNKADNFFGKGIRNSLEYVRIFR